MIRLIQISLLIFAFLASSVPISGTVPLKRSREDCSPGPFNSGIRATSFWERAGANHSEDGFTNTAKRHELGRLNEEPAGATNHHQQANGRTTEPQSTTLLQTGANGGSAEGN